MEGANARATKVAIDRQITFDNEVKTLVAKLESGKTVEELRMLHALQRLPLSQNIVLGTGYLRIDWPTADSLERLELVGARDSRTVGAYIWAKNDQFAQAVISEIHARAGLRSDTAVEPTETQINRLLYG